jgi:hypothetical protein
MGWVHNIMTIDVYGIVVYCTATVLPPLAAVCSFTQIGTQRSEYTHRDWKHALLSEKAKS